MHTLFRSAVLFTILLGAAGDAVSAPPAPSAEVAAIEIVPGNVAVGQLPKVTGRIARTSAPVPLEPAMFNIIAVVKLPSNVTKSKTWKNESFEKGQTKDYPLTIAYDTRQPGSYSVEYIVYNLDMSRRLAMSSRTFTVGDAAPPQAGKKETPPAAVKKEAPRQPTGVRNTAGIGIYGNALNPAGGGTLLLWPFEHVGLQASYTVGTFTTAEARMLARFSPVWGVRPYIGVGYLNVTTTEDVIGVSTDFKDSSISGVAGVEVPLGRRWFGYIEVSGASIDLQEIVTNGGQTVKATVDYAPVTIGVSIIYYFF